MRLNIKTLVAVSVIGAMIGPALAMAKTSKTVRPLVNPANIEKTDRNIIGVFSRAQANKKLKTVSGKVAAISETSITVRVSWRVKVNSHQNSNVNAGTTIQTKDYKFGISPNTLIIRKFKGRATVNEIAIGDSVWVRATALTNGTAKVIWDKTIWRVGYNGTISNLNPTAKTFDLTVTIHKIDYKVSVKWDDATQVTQGGTTVVAKTTADLVNGQKITMRGSWNSVGKYILAKTINILP